MNSRAELHAMPSEDTGLRFFPTLMQHMPLYSKEMCSTFSSSNKHKHSSLTELTSKPNNDCFINIILFKIFLKQKQEAKSGSETAQLGSQTQTRCLEITLKFVWNCPTITRMKINGKRLYKRTEGNCSGNKHNPHCPYPVTMQTQKLNSHNNLEQYWYRSFLILFASSSLMI